MDNEELRARLRRKYRQTVKLLANMNKVGTISWTIHA